MNNEAIIVERVYDAPVQKVWDALTNSDLMKQWYFDIPGFMPEVGFNFTFTGGPDESRQYVHVCIITEVIPNKKLSHTWSYDGYTGNSLVTWELFEQGDKTKLVLTHEGVDTFDAENPDLARPNFVEGWDSIVNENLTKFLKK